MSRIGGGGPKPPPDAAKDVQQTKAESAQTKEAAPPETQKSSASDKAADKFELKSKLDSITGQKGAGAKTQFTNADIAELVKTFAAVLKQNPNADRLKRARLFARSVLKGKKLRKLFGEATDAELEQMFEAIAEQLESSPFFAQLLEDVSEETLKTASQT